jgi:ABC-2 type transport system ATP-binding protein
LRLLDGAGISVLDVALRRPTLDDVFLTLTGHAAETDTAAPADEDSPPKQESGQQSSSQQAPGRPRETEEVSR